MHFRQAIFVPFLLTLISWAATDVWVLNLDGTPAVLDVEPTSRLGAYTLRNMSAKKIVSYTLGCVDTNETVPVVVYMLPSREFSLDPHWSMDAGIMDAPYTLEYAECVHIRKVKMGVVQVNFDDGTAWNAGIDRVTFCNISVPSELRAAPLVITYRFDAGKGGGLTKIKRVMNPLPFDESFRTCIAGWSLPSMSGEGRADFIRNPGEGSLAVLSISGKGFQRSLRYYRP